MGLLDGIIGGVIGAEVTHLVAGMIQSHGGLQGLVSQFEQQGMGNVVQSWIGNGSNLPISAEQLQQVLGNDKVAALAQKFGIEPQELMQKLAAALPKAVDQMTPGGTIPTS
jgi:uncharacterized protein YidB (DUF937 family)